MKQILNFCHPNRLNIIVMTHFVNYKHNFRVKSTLLHSNIWKIAVTMFKISRYPIIHRKIGPKRFLYSCNDTGVAIKMQLDSNKYY